MSPLALGVFVFIAIFATWQVALLVRDVVRARKNKSAVIKTDDLKGDKD